MYNVYTRMRVYVCIYNIYIYIHIHIRSIPEVMMYTTIFYHDMSTHVSDTTHGDTLRDLRSARLSTPKLKVWGTARSGVYQKAKQGDNKINDIVSRSLSLLYYYDI